MLFLATRQAASAEYILVTHLNISHFRGNGLRQIRGRNAVNIDSESFLVDSSCASVAVITESGRQINPKHHGR